MEMLWCEHTGGRGAVNSGCVQAQRIAEKERARSRMGAEGVGKGRKSGWVRGEKVR